MDVKRTALSQYQAIVNQVAKRFHGNTRLPTEGWIATVRKALGMSGVQLANRMGITRARIAQVEHAEAEGAITLKTMQGLAAAMGCEFVYAIIPQRKIEDVLAAQARKKAQALVQRASGHMALEDQALSERQNAKEVERIAQQLLRDMPSDLWRNP